MISSKPNSLLFFAGAWILLASFVATMGAEAQPAEQDAATEKCVGYRQSADGQYRLINECNYVVTVAWCSDNPTGTGECSRKIGWQNARVDPKAEVPGLFDAGQTISLFACRSPKNVEILVGGSARCDSGLFAAEPPAAPPILPAAALKNPSSIITAADFPASARGKQGTTRFDMTVDASGRPVSCSVTVSSGYQDLDNAACKAFLKRAKFSPAKDAQGRAIAGRYRGTVSWKSP
jgi:TonB family protein